MTSLLIKKMNKSTRRWVIHYAPYLATEGEIPCIGVMKFDVRPATYPDVRHEEVKQEVARWLPRNNSRSLVVSRIFCVMMNREDHFSMELRSPTESVKIYEEGREINQ